MLNQRNFIACSFFFLLWMNEVRMWSLRLKESLLGKFMAGKGNTFGGEAK